MSKYGPQTLTHADGSTSHFQVKDIQENLDHVSIQCLDYVLAPQMVERKSSFHVFDLTFDEYESLKDCHDFDEIKLSHMVERMVGGNANQNSDTWNPDETPHFNLVDKLVKSVVQCINKEKK